MRFIFIIDTDKYAGNFEREMCAYMTGHVGECGVGENIAEDFEEEFPREYKKFEAIILKVTDDNGCFRPVQIEPIKNTRAYNAVGINFSERPHEKLIEFMKSRAEEFAKAKKLNISGYRIVKEETIRQEFPT
jgi:hypothetical protein